MRTMIAATALAAALLGPNAAWANHPHSNPHNGAPAGYGHAPHDTMPKRSATPTQATSPHDVFSYDGEYLGRDPDPRIRSQLLRDDAWRRGG